MSFTARQIITSALRKLGVVASGETPEADEMTDSLEALTLMLKSWSVRRQLVYVTTQESFPLVSGTNEYTMGSGGDFDTVRPKALVQCWVRDSSGVDYWVKIVDEHFYNSISVKSSGGRPYLIYILPGYPLATLKLYPTPDSTESLYLVSHKSLSTLADLDATLTMPEEYEEAVIFNLAVRVSPDFGVEVPAVVAAIASETLGAVRALNAQAQAQSVDALKYIISPNNRQWGYNINEG